MSLQPFALALRMSFWIVVNLDVESCIVNSEIVNGRSETVNFVWLILLDHGAEIVLPRFVVQVSLVNSCSFTNPKFRLISSSTLHTDATDNFLTASVNPYVS